MCCAIVEAQTAAWSKECSQGWGVVCRVAQAAYGPPHHVDSQKKHLCSCCARRWPHRALTDDGGCRIQRWQVGPVPVCARVGPICAPRSHLTQSKLHRTRLGIWAYKIVWFVMSLRVPRLMTSFDRRETCLVQVFDEL
jgi:hypothetical protein